MTIGVGIIGGGTVGGGVIETLVGHGEDLANKAGNEVRLAHVCTRTPARLDGVDLGGAPLTDDVDALLNDPNVNVVCELIGGEEPAKALTLKALNAGKHVVTANKMLLALHGPELTKAATANGVELRYEAAVAGGIPIIKSVREGLAGNRIKNAYAILNGTCNYILSRMTYEDMDFTTVLEQAMELGFAETPPDLDINGDDTAHKCQILASLCFGTQVDLADIYTEGITHITHEDVANARLHFENGCVAQVSASRVSYEMRRAMHVWSDGGFAAMRPICGHHAQWAATKGLINGAFFASACLGYPWDLIALSR